MAYVSIPLPTTDQPHVLQSTTLEGVSYQFVFDWNSRTDRWTMSIYNEDNTPIVTGVTLAIGIDLLSVIPWTRANVPSGFLYLAGVDDPTLETIGDVSLIYIESTESSERNASL